MPFGTTSFFTLLTMIKLGETRRKRRRRRRRRQIETSVWLRWMPLVALLLSPVPPPLSPSQPKFSLKSIHEYIGLASLAARRLASSVHRPVDFSWGREKERKEDRPGKEEI